MHSSGSASSNAARRTGVLVLALTIAAGLAAGLRMPQLVEGAHLLPVDDPAVRLDREITAEFGMAAPVVWIVEARHGTVWTPKLLARLSDLTRDVLTIPGVIALDVVGLASPNLRDLRVTDDMLEPVYLMGEVPQTAAEIDALRARVDSNPNYGGALVSRDGRAAMVVANFTESADAAAVATAALALRDRYSDPDASIFVTGAPVLAHLAPRVAPLLATGAALILGIGMLGLWRLAGGRTALAAALAAVLAPVWAAGLVAAGGAAVLPWSAYALPATAILAAAVATASPANWRRRLEMMLALAMGWIAFAVIAGSPAAALGIAAAAGVVTAVAAGDAARVLLRPRALAAGSGVMWMGLGVLLLVALAAIGLPRVHTAFGMFGYGVRYLPAALAIDLRAVERHFPPPAALAVRFRGEPGFVASPDVLQAMDALGAAARRDSAVVRVVSLADVIKLVHRSFNDNDEAFAVIPDQRPLIARYLALAYSPGFARFVDRGFTRSAVWVYLATDDPTALRRVRTTLEQQLAHQPVPGAHVDFAGGDGAVVLAAAALAQRLTLGALVLVVVSVAGLAVLAGWRVGAAALMGGVPAAMIAFGTFGWLDVPLDLVSLPILITGTAAGVALAAVGGGRGLPAALALMTAVAATGVFAGVPTLGVVMATLFGGPAVASVTARAIIRDTR